MHVAVEQRRVHGLRQGIHQHVIGGNPSDLIFEVLYSLPNIQQVKSYPLFLGGAGRFDAANIIQGLAIRS